MFKHSIFLSLFSFFCFVLPAQASPDSQTFAGEPLQVGTSEFYSTTEVTSEGVRSLSILFHAELLDQLMDQGKEKSFVVPLPTDVDLRPYDHISLDWIPHGHEPPGVYDIPHFDIHFYFNTIGARSEISCQGEDLANCELQPASEHIPERYIPTPGGVPMMGSHWVDPESPEFNGGRFFSSFLYGFYKGEIVFLEPMVTGEFLKTRPNFVQEIMQPAQYARAGHYPTQYRVEWLMPTDRYKISLEKMRYLEANEPVQEE